jgi:hypothetical protein
LHRQQRTFIIVVVLLLLFIYLGYRSHSSGTTDERSREYHRGEINKDKEAWQEKLNQVS